MKGLAVMLSVVGLLGGQFASAQTAKRLRLSDTAKVKTSVRDWLDLEAVAGLNVPISRNARNSFEEWRTFAPRPGAAVGLNFVVFPRESVHLLLGMEYLHERGRMEDYRRDANRDAPARRIGKLSYVENGIRLNFLLRVPVWRLAWTAGFQISSRFRSTYRYDYTQTTTELTDVFTGTRVPLEEPIVSQYSATQRLRRGGYVGFVTGVGYSLTPRLAVQARLDLGLHLWSNVRIDAHGRARMDFTAVYSLLPDSGAP